MCKKLFASCRGAVNSSAGISDVPSPDYTGVTPLIEAVRNCHVEIVKLLLEKGAFLWTRISLLFSQNFLMQVQTLQMHQKMVGPRLTRQTPPS